MVQGGQARRAIANARLTRHNARAAAAPSHMSPLGCLFNSLDSPSSLHEDAHINAKAIGCLRVESAGCILLTYWERYERLIVFVAECQPRPSDFAVVFTLEI